MSGTLQCSQDDFERALRRWILDGKKVSHNALGQTALHLAVLSPGRLGSLLDAGMPADSIDRGGTTPLMYAAAYGQADSVIVLIQADADFTLHDDLNGRLFLDYAVKRGNINVIARLVQHLRANGERVSASIALNRCLALRLINRGDTWNNEDLVAILDLGADPDCMINGASTSMHLTLFEEEALALLRYNFTAIGIVDEYGVTPLMHNVRFLSPKLMTKLLDLERGDDLDINCADHAGWTALMHLVNAAAASHGPWRTSKDADNALKATSMLCMNLLLRQGAHAQHRTCDSSACCPLGSSPMTTALHHGLNGLRWGSSSKRLNCFPIAFCTSLIIRSRGCLDAVVEDLAAFNRFLASGIQETDCNWYRHARNGGSYSARSGPMGQQVAVLEILPPSYSPISEPGDMVPMVGLAKHLALYYHLLKRRSIAKREKALERRARRARTYGPQPKTESWYVDTRKDTCGRCFTIWDDVPSVASLELEEYEGWVAWCVEQKRKLGLPVSLEIWSQSALSFTGHIRDELARLSMIP